MKNIGLQLKEARIAKNLELEDVAQKTKITISRLEAIENGDMAYFDNDLSYLKFYLKLYCQAVDINYDSIKDDLQNAMRDYDDVTKTNVMIAKKQLEDNIQEKIEKKPKPEKKKIDIPLLTMGVAVVVLVILLALVLFKFGYQDGKFSFDFLNGETTETEQSDPYLEPSDPIDEPIIEDEQSEVEKVNLVITQDINDSSRYTISGYSSNQEVSIRFECNEAQTYLKFTVNDTVVNNPAKGTYASGNNFELVYTPNSGDVIDLNFGVLGTNKLFINDEEIEISQRAGATRHIYFSFK